MTRKNIFEILNNNYNILKEIQKIVELSNLKLIIYDDGYTKRTIYTIEEFFDKKIIKDWKQRGSYICSEEIKQTLKISERIGNTTTFEEYIKIVEYYSNIIYLIVAKFGILNRANYYTDDLFTILFENIEIMLDHINYEKLIIKKEEKVLLIPKKPESIAVAEISSEETALAILKYNHASLKDDLEGKRSLLFAIYREYEPLLKNPVEGYADFYKKVKQLYNMLDIRHNNKSKENNKNTVIDITNEELEKWYDELYQLLLFCVLIKDNIKRKKDVDEFLKTIKNKTYKDVTI